MEHIRNTAAPPPDADSAENAVDAPDAAMLPALPGSFDPVPLRHRHDGWTPERQRAFIEHLADTLCPAAAAAAVGMSERSAYALRRHTGAEGFAAAWDAALLRGIGEQGRSRLVDQAVNGRVLRRFYHGKLIAEERVYSERVLLALIQHGGKLFEGAGAERSRAIAGDWDGSMERLEQGLLSDGFRIWRDRFGDWMTNYPPPPGFDRDCYAGEPWDPDFERPLSEAEEQALAARQATRLEAGAKARDLFFGFSPGRRAIDRRVRSEER